jgi:4,5-dihydroxyphthalate decarboxylase
MKPRIKLALGSYDRHGPLLEGAIDHPLFDFDFFELDPQQGRHERFLQGFEFDACELSFSSYVVAVDQGLPVHAVPIFPRRLFSQSQMYKHLRSGINAPNDLAGKRIGLSSYQNTLGVRTKGDLAHFYGVPWKSVTWVVAGEDVVGVERPEDVKIEHAKNMAEIEQAFVEGTIHALFVSRLPRPFLRGDLRVGRFFTDPAGEEERYLREEGYFPIMHVLAFKRELSERFAELPAALFQLFEQARRTARQRWNDPNWSMLLWGRRELEHQEAVCGFDPWQNGLEPNRKNIERFALYSYEQGLSRRHWQPEELFVPIHDDRGSKPFPQESPSHKHPR